MKFTRNAITSLLSMVALLLIAGCTHQTPDSTPSLANTVISGDQLLVAVAESAETSQIKLYLLARTSHGWELRTGPLPGIIGRNGFAPYGEKREGDGRAPTGLFPLEFAFGYDPSIDSLMPYRQATENDLWVDDVQSSDYNTWVKRGESSATSYEVMKLADNRYRHGLVVGYNRNPIIKGAGSGIFVHAWLEDGYTTSGCVAFDDAELVKLLAWLDPAQKPQILMGIRQDLAAVAGLPSLPSGNEQQGLLEQQIRSKVAGLKERSVEYRAPDGFFGIALAVPTTVADAMRLKMSWKEGCPIPISDLNYLVLTHWGFDGKPKVGEMVVHKKLALAVIKAFAELFNAKFPIERMELIEKYDANDDLSMEANNSSAFNCRDITNKPGFWSKHSYGGAIDINPVQNPYRAPKSAVLKTMGWDGQEEVGTFLQRNGYDVPLPALAFCTARPSDCLVLPPASINYIDRSLSLPGMLLAGTREVRAFTDRGFDWGATWQRLMDYQHFEYDTAKLLQK